VAQPERSPVANYANPASLEGRGFVVLGAGQGIGRQTSHALAQAGARVFCVDRDQALADSVSREVKGFACVADVTARADVERVFAEAVVHFGDTLGGLVDIVGIADIRKIPDTDDASWNRNFDLNVRHAYLAIQIGSRAMAKGGSMVFVSSISGTHSIENEVSYGAAKAALNHLVRGAAHELGPQNIRVNAVTPGFRTYTQIAGGVERGFLDRSQDLYSAASRRGALGCRESDSFPRLGHVGLCDRRGDSSRRRTLHGGASAAHPVRAGDADEG